MYRSIEIRIYQKISFKKKLFTAFNFLIIKVSSPVKIGRKKFSTVHEKESHSQFRKKKKNTFLYTAEYIFSWHIGITKIFSLDVLF